MFKQIKSQSLILPLMGVYFPLQIFVLLLLAVRNKEGGLNWELPILLTIHEQSQEQLDLLASRLTDLGSFWTTTPLILGIALSFLLAKRWNFFLYIIITFLGAIDISYMGKILIHRARPRLWELFYQVGTDYSFPSGHAMSSMSFALVLIFLTWNTSWRWLVVTLSSLFVVTIGWTRLYLGVHYPSDIVGGWTIAISWAMMVIWTLKLILNKQIGKNF